jgi:para-aminobenzoate synthetase component I
MTVPVAQDIPYRPDSAPVFDALVQRSQPIFLDSGRPYCDQGRFDGPAQT